MKSFVIKFKYGVWKWDGVLQIDNCNWKYEGRNFNEFRMRNILFVCRNKSSKRRIKKEKIHQRENDINSLLLSSSYNLVRTYLLN